MDIIKYYEFLTKLNWDYKSLPLNQLDVAHKEYDRAIRLSFTSRDHRSLFLKIKKNKLTDEK